MKRKESTAIAKSENECDHPNYYPIFELWHKFKTKLVCFSWVLQFFVFSILFIKCPPGCMRFLVRFALLGAILLLFILALALQQNSFIKSNKSAFNKSQEKQTKHSISKETGPSAEEKEIRRLLLRAADLAPDEGVVVPPAISGSNGGGGNNQQQLEMAVGAGLLFPIGRYPQGGKPGGVSPVLTLNVAVVLVVSLLSIAVLITAICCVIIIALAMDSATNIDSIMPGGGGSSHSADFLLSNWPNLMLNGPDIGGSSVHFDKFLATRSAQYNMTPPLTDDEEDEEETTALMMDVEDLESGIARGNCAFSQQNFNDRERLIFLDETENIEGSWPAKI